MALQKILKGCIRTAVKPLLALLGFMALAASAQLALNNAPFAALLSRQGPANSEPFFEEFMEAPGFENVWTTNNAGAVIDPDNSTAPLQGTYSLSMALTSDGTSVRSSIGTHTTISGFFLIRFSNLPAENSDEDFYALNNAGGKVLSIFRNVGSVWTIKANADVGISTVGTMANNTTYYVWWSYSSGSGANGSYSLAFSEDATKPASGNNFVQTTTSAATDSVTTVRLGADALPGTDTWSARFDAVMLQSSPIGSNPF